MPEVQFAMNLESAGSDNTSSYALENYDDDIDSEGDDDFYQPLYKGAPDEYLNRGKTFQPRSLQRYSQNLDLDGYYNGPKVSGNTLNSLNCKLAAVKLGGNVDGFWRRGVGGRQSC